MGRHDREAPILPLLLEFLKLRVLRCETAFAGDIDHERHLAAELIQGDLLSGQIVGRECVDVYLAFLGGRGILGDFNHTSIARGHDHREQESCKESLHADMVDHFSGEGVFFPEVGGCSGTVSDDLPDSF